jgi:hypothetical protein
MADLEHDLLRLGEIVAGVAVQCKLAKRCEGDDVFGNNLGRIQNIKTPAQLVILLENLSLKDPLRVLAIFDALEQVLAVEIGVHSGGDLSLFPQERGLTLHRPESELDEFGLAFIGNKTEGVHAPTVGVPV